LSEHELKRLRWRCRRGMKELDHLLLRWLEREWPAAGDERRAAFGALLECEDDRLWRCFTGKEPPPDDGPGRLIDEIRADAGL